MARFCTGCGAPLDDDKRFCTACGTPVPGVEEAAGLSQPDTSPPQPPPQAAVVPPSPSPQAAVPPPPAPQVPVALPPSPSIIPASGDGAPAKDSKYAVITTGGYIGIMLLMCIPILGQLLTLVWALGGCRKVNKRNMARAMLVFLIISLVLSAICYFTFSYLWKSSGLGDLLGQAGGMGELGDAMKELEELKNMMPAQ